MAKWNQTKREVSMEGSLQSFLISYRSDYTVMAAMDNSCFWLADIKKSSCLKQLGQTEPSLTGRICGEAFIKFPHFILINKIIWPLFAIHSSPLYKCNYCAKWNQNWQEASLWSPFFKVSFCRPLISSFRLSFCRYLILSLF